MNLRILEVSACGDVESLRPLGGLNELEELHAWGTTRVVDGDLRPILGLPHLRELRMRDRPTYTPRVAEIVTALAARVST